MYVLGGPPAHQDPTQGPWEYLGPIQNMDNKQWAIDGTVVELDGQLYFIYSGWPFDNPTESDLIQRLYILRLQDPLTATSEAVEICRPQEGFEHSGDHRINEGNWTDGDFPMCLTDVALLRSAVSCESRWIMERYRVFLRGIVD